MSNLIGVVNIYKEKGFTSHDVVNIVRKTLGKVKTGHTGTLDPDACGVLPICVGKATKISDYIASDIKEYKAELLLGVSTDTQDISGEVIKKSDVEINFDVIKNTILSFEGEYYQTPPMYSAVKINGKKMYELAREGKEVERKQRLVKIFNIKINEVISKERVVFTALCSKGTYIRTLCHDIGEKLSCGGCMASLLRTRAGQFYIKDSIKIEDFKKIVCEGRINEILIPVDNVLPEYSKVIVSDLGNKFLYNGNKINVNFTDKKYFTENEKALVYDSYGKLIGIYQFYGNFIKPLTMLI